ncbi:hypothetical protein RSO01_14050 [Reyranella soli]|uniref:Uncharacterized protein n=1 Tax=Reyranella soli TaxID=1230389 RepID=A0A512N5H7_9HYPH|nr:hypothetical protein RSO01_14050 [Reyranella soli]
MTDNDDSNDCLIAPSHTRRRAISKSRRANRKKDCVQRSMDSNHYLAERALHELAEANAYLKDVRAAAWLIMWLLIELAARLS